MTKHDHRPTAGDLVSDIRAAIAQAESTERCLDLVDSMADFRAAPELTAVTLAKAISLADSTWDFAHLADAIIKFAGDKAQARMFYQKAIAMSEYPSEFYSIAESVLNLLGDRQWADGLFTEALRLADEFDLMAMIPSLKKRATWADEIFDADPSRGQRTDAIALPGRMKCERDTYTLCAVIITGKGETTKGCVSLLTLFGDMTFLLHLHKILLARTSHINCDPGLMSQDAAALCRICLCGLVLAKRMESLPVIAPLLHDPDMSIRSWATYAMTAISTEAPLG